MTSATYAARISKMAGLLVAGGVFGAVAASALATSVAPAPAQALDACFSSALTGTLKTGGASCSSAGPLQWAIAIGANTYAEVAGGLFNLAIAVGDNSLAYTTPDVGGTSYFNIATAAAGGYAQASDGIFQIATAFESQPDEDSGAFATYGAFGVARAIGVNAWAQTGAGGNLERVSAFNIARARGENSTAFAQFGFGNSSRAFGLNSYAAAYDGNRNIARALGNGAVSNAGGSPTAPASFNIARALGTSTDAYAGTGDFNIASAIGTAVQAQAGGIDIGRGSFNIARVAGSNSYAGAGAFDATESVLNIASVIGDASEAYATYGSLNTARVFGNTSVAQAGPGSGRRAIVVGSNQTKIDPPQSASSRRAAASVRSASHR
jgi:hypothetical protein